MRKHTCTVIALILVNTAILAGQALQQFDPNANLKTGPVVGEKIPAFSAADQTGRIRDFTSLKGPKGLVLFFNRSVDW